jgi:hypothetical protein
MRLNTKDSAFLFSSRAFCCLLLTLTVASAQSPVAKLVPEMAIASPVLQPGTLAGQPGDNAQLRIQIIEGERGVNIIKKRSAVAPVVEVRDRNNRPAAGALVTFSAPDDGASLVFLNGSRSITVVAEADGRATTTGLTPINPGSFELSVAATYQSQVATASIKMTNVPSAADASSVEKAGTVATATAPSMHSGGLSKGMIFLIAGVAAAAAAGLAFGLTHHGAKTQTTTIGVGTGTVGAP